jgi:RNA polymerase primary sigma factor
MTKYKDPNIINGNNTRKEEYQELFRKFRQGDKNLRKDLIYTFQPLVIRIARKYHWHGLEDGDLINNGNIGLMDCIDNHYDPDKAGKNPESYVAEYIRREIVNKLGDGGIIKLPINRIAKMRRLAKDSEKYEKRYGRKPTIEELAESTHISEELIEVLFRFFDEPASLDLTIDKKRTVGDYVFDEKTSGQDETFVEMDAVQREVQELLGKTNLNIRQKQILYERVGLNGNRYSMTFEEIALGHRITTERARQIYQRAIEKIREANGLI